MGPIRFKHVFPVTTLPGQDWTCKASCTLRGLEEWQPPGTMCNGWQATIYQHEMRMNYFSILLRVKLCDDGVLLTIPETSS